MRGVLVASMTRTPDRDLQALLAEEPFVRALACALAAGDADDLAQQTWLMALQQRGPVGKPRSWLRRVATNLARNLARSDRRRGERERAAAVRERVPSSAELMEREERRSALVRAVDRLPVELREVVLLRWFEGLEPSRIAVELGVPVTTVWNRLRSALQRLRERLDADHDDERRAWLLPLLPGWMAKGQAAPALPVLLWGACAMTTKTKVAVVLGVLLLLGAGYLWWPDSRGPGSVLSANAPQGVVATAVPVAEKVNDAPSATPQRVAVANPDGTAPATGALIVRAVRGADRAPAAAEMLIVTRKNDFSAVRAAYVRTDAAGVARIDSLLPGTIDVRVLQHNQAAQAEIRAGEVAELEYLLPLGATVTGVVVDTDDRPIAGAQVDLLDFSNSDPAAVTTTDADGRFTIRNAYPMSLIGARGADHAASRLQMLITGEGGSVEVRIQLLMPGGTVTGVVRGLGHRPVAGALVRVGMGRIEGPVSSVGLPPVAVPVRTDAEGRFRAVGLAPGEQRLFVRARGFGPWQGECFVNEHAATGVLVDLEAAVICTGIVRDEGEAPAPGVEVSSGKGSEFSYEHTMTASDGTFVLVDRPTGEMEVHALHEILGNASVAVSSSAPGSTVTCELRLSHGIQLRGRVLDDDGVGFAEVGVSAVAQGSLSAGISGRTDAEGRFVLVNCPSGLLTVEASKDNQDVQRHQVDPKQGEIELRLHREPPAPPPSVRISGQVTGPDGREVPGASISATCFATGQSRHGVTAADGTFAFGPLPPGTWQVYVPPQRFPGFASERRELAADANWDLGHIQLIEGGTALVRVLGAPAGAEVQFNCIRQRKTGAVGGVERDLASASWIGDRVLRSKVLAPGDCELYLTCDGCARQVFRFTVRAGEETSVEARLVAGIRQRVEFARSDGARMSFNDLVQTLRRGDELLIDHNFVSWNRPLVYGADGAALSDLWLAPGTYYLDAREKTATGSADFTVADREGPTVRIVLR